ncbi:hypothetical protein [uncultured Megasphaera sp.]|uniref:hypothetical protein n=1 Tax=uncultured Megasphaera sp. TaxID=165188 RepID=UPI0026583674|nr:hypothetical protein [uncultured Megasphaera sp.]
MNEMVSILCSVVLGAVFVYVGQGLVRTVSSFLDERCAAETEHYKEVPQRYR